MSEEGSFGLTAAEKFFGLILILVGSIATYYTFTSAQSLAGYTGFFGFLSILLIFVGILLILAKTE